MLVEEHLCLNMGYTTQMLGENVDIKFWGLFSARNNYDHRSIKCPQYTSIIFHIDVDYPHYIIHEVTKKNYCG